MSFQITAQADGESVEVLIYDDIYSAGCEFFGGVCADDIIAAIRPYKDREILVRINSPGGDVSAGLALYSVLQEFNVTTVIDGWAASAASLIALAGGTVRMARNAFIMIHNPSGIVIGEASDMRKQADQLDKARGQLVDIYARETGNSEEVIGRWMDEEKWFTGQEALDAGFVDEVIEQPAQTAHLGKLSKRFRNVPPQLGAEGAIRDSNNKSTTRMATASTTDITACGCGGKTAAVVKGADETAALRTERDELKAQIENLKAQLELIKTKDAAALKARAITAVDAAIADKRLEPVLREPMIRAYVENENETLTTLASLKKASVAGAPAGTDPLRIRNEVNTLSLEEQIQAETDPRKRLALTRANWAQLLNGKRD